MDPVKAAETGEALSKTNSVGTTFATANVAINILLGASLKPLWGMINTL